MLKEPTLLKPRELQLTATVATWVSQREDPSIAQVDFDTRFGLLVDAEVASRDNKRLDRALREAKPRIATACLEDIDFAPTSELDRALVRQLATGHWLTSHANSVITGMTGTGHTYLGCALAQQACRLGRRALYRRIPRLLEEAALAPRRRYLPAASGSAREGRCARARRLGSCAAAGRRTPKLAGEPRGQARQPLDERHESDSGRKVA